MRQFSETEILEAYHQAPSLVQEELTTGKVVDFVMGIESTYNLHVDVIGKISEMIRNTLLGLFTPAEFYGGLYEIGLSPDVAQRLLADLNEAVFKPLHEKERAGDTVAPRELAPKVSQPSAPPAASVSLASSIEKTPAPYAGARPQPLTPFNLPGVDANPDDLFRSSTRTVAPVPVAPVPPVTVAPPPQPIPVPAPTPMYVPVSPIAPVPIAPPVVTVAPALQVPKVTLPPYHMPVEKVSTPPQTHSNNQSALGGTLRTMATDMLAVNEHRTPEPVQYKGTVYTPPVFMEAPTKPVPKPPLNKIQAPFQPAPAQSPPSAQTRPTVTPTPTHELVKEYSSDPYREPLQ